MIRGSREIEETLLEHLGVKRNGLCYYSQYFTLLIKHAAFSLVTTKIVLWALVSYAISEIYCWYFCCLCRGDKWWFIFCWRNGVHGNVIWWDSISDYQTAPFSCLDAGVVYNVLMKKIRLFLIDSFCRKHFYFILFLRTRMQILSICLSCICRVAVWMLPWLLWLTTRKVQRVTHTTIM